MKEALLQNMNNLLSILRADGTRYSVNRKTFLQIEEEIRKLATYSHAIEIGSLVLTVCPHEALDNGGDGEQDTDADGAGTEGDGTV